MERAQLVASSQIGEDIMTLVCEVTTNDATLEAALMESIRAVTKLRGDVRLVRPGSLSNNGRVIEDAPKYR